MSVLVGLSLPLAGELISYWNLDETEGVNAADSVGENVATFQDPDGGLEGIEGRAGNAAKLTDSGRENYPKNVNGRRNPVRMTGGIRYRLIERELIERISR